MQKHARYRLAIRISNSRNVSQLIRKMGRLSYVLASFVCRSFAWIRFPVERTFALLLLDKMPPARVNRIHFALFESCRNLLAGSWYGSDSKTLRGYIGHRNSAHAVGNKRFAQSIGNVRFRRADALSQFLRCLV